MQDLRIWLDRFPPPQARLYRNLLAHFNAKGFCYAIGGGLAYAIYSRRWRDTNDLDLFILPRHREAMIGELVQAGFVDYHDRVPYDRGWLYRGYQEGVILDLIWQMANYHAQVDERWILRGPKFSMDGGCVRLLPIEELLWAKLYIVQRDRCDWPDLLAVLYHEGARLNWSHLLVRLEDDFPLLAGLLAVFGWLCPERAREFPSWLWPRLGLAPIEKGPASTDNSRRVNRLDSRDWFYPEKRVNLNY